jgi:hypothetical protein
VVLKNNNTIFTHSFPPGLGLVSAWSWLCLVLALLGLGSAWSWSLLTFDVIFFNGLFYYC